MFIWVMIPVICGFKITYTTMCVLHICVCVYDIIQP